MRRLAVGFLTLGAALRLWLFLSRPSLSIDETMLSLEIGLRSFAGLLRPLDSIQTAPPLFLWGVKLCATLGGMNEYALRALPLVSGLLVPVGVWRVARRLWPEPVALGAAGLAAFAPTLVQYSVTVKPYVSDALFALVTIVLALDVLDRPDVLGAWVWLALGGVVSILVSIPAPFVLAGAAAALAAAPSVRRSPRSMARVGACVLVWGAAFAPLYVWFYRPAATSAYMQQFWVASFFDPLRVGGWRLVGVALEQALDARPATLAAIVVAGTVLGGLWHCWRTRGAGIAVLLGSPGLALIAASAVHRYPLSGRVLVFLVPSIILCVTAAVAAACAWRRYAGWALGAVPVFALAAIDLTHPYRTPATRPAIAALDLRAGAREPIYLMSGAIPAWTFYTTDWRDPDTLYLQDIARLAGRPGAAAYSNSGPRGKPVGPDEGRELELRHDGRVELLGLASGIQWRAVTGLSALVPDSGWAEHEAARIRGAASPTILVLLANGYATAAPRLVAALGEAGGGQEMELVTGGVRAYRFRFGSTTARN